MSTRFNSFDINQLIDNLPAGLDRAILRVLSFHQGRDKAIGRTKLVVALADHGFKIEERAMRAQISQLRKNGNLICSVPGEKGGYYLPSNVEEFEEFVAQEYRAKIIDMQETLGAMQKAAEHRFGKFSPAKQPSLFG